MNFIKMIIDEGVWKGQKEHGFGMTDIRCFLEYDVSFDDKTYAISLLLNPECTTIVCEYMYLVKKDDVIELHYIYPQEDSDPNRPEFSTAALIDLLNQWQAMCDKRDPRLVGAYITYDGTQFHVQPEFDTVVKKIKRLYKKLSRPVIRFLARYNLVKDPYALPFKIQDINFQGDLEIQGFHFDPLGDLEKQKIITFEDKLVCPSTGMVRATIVRPGQLMPTAHVSMFPPAWSKEEWALIIDESLQHALKDGVLVAGFAVQHAITQDGLVIEFIINVEAKELVSAYPLLRK